MKKKIMRQIAAIIFNKMVCRLSPAKVGVQITTKCNLSCSYCFARKKKDSLSIEDITNIVKDLKKMNISFFVISGGEPLLHPNLDQIISIAKKHGLYTGIASNGLLLTPAIAKRHKQIGLDVYHFSLSSTSGKLSDGKSPSKVISAIRTAHLAGISVSVTTTVTMENLSEIEGIVKILVENGVEYWTPTMVVPCGEGQNYVKQHKWKIDDINNSYEHLQKVIRDYKNKIGIIMMDPQMYYPYLLEKGKLSFFEKLAARMVSGCGVINGKSIYINADGTVKPCAYFDYCLPGVNVKKQRIIDIFRKNKVLCELRDKKKLNKKCRTCRHCQICGGCRSRAYALTGDMFACDPYCFRNL